MRQTGGLTFSLYESTPEHCRLPEPSDYYARGDAWAKVQEDVPALRARGMGPFELHVGRLRGWARSVR